jgi:hypothetical protein
MADDDTPQSPPRRPNGLRIVIDNDPSVGLVLHNMGEYHGLRPPPRRWILEGTFCKNTLSGLIGSGGTGKTALRLLQLIAVALGRGDLVGRRILGRQRYRVLVLCLEDEFEEIWRRIAAACEYYEIRMDELLDCFWVTAPEQFKLAVLGADGWRMQAGAAAEVLRRTILEKGIDLVSIDPLLRAHEANENDNAQMDAVCGMLIRMAIDRGCAVDFLHHTAKGINEPGDSGRMRGASAMRDGARLLYTLTPMAKKEARDEFGVSEAERRRLMRLDSAKVNILPPATRTTWFRLVDVKLKNGDDEHPDGDLVQTVELWRPPGESEDLDPPVVHLILDRLEAGPRPGGHYGLRPQTREERAAWRVVQMHRPGLTRNRCNDLLKRWIKEGWLVERPYQDPGSRKNYRGLFVVKRPLGRDSDRDFTAVLM